MGRSSLLQRGFRRGGARVDTELASLNWNTALAPDGLKLNLPVSLVVCARYFGFPSIQGKAGEAGEERKAGGGAQAEELQGDLSPFCAGTLISPAHLFVTMSLRAERNGEERKARGRRASKGLVSPRAGNYQLH